MIAAFFRAVNRAKTVPPSPFRGDWGSFFAQISGVIFYGKCCVWGIIGGVYIQAIKIPDRAHKTLRRAAGHDRRQNGGGQEPGQDGRQISGRRRRQIGATTSGTHLPYLGGAYAMALVDSKHTQVGTTVEVDVRGRRVGAEIVPLPFYKRAK